MAAAGPKRAELVELGWSGATMPVGSHVCCYYSSQSELRDMMRFLCLGLAEDGTLCVVFADASRFDTLVGWLTEQCDADVPSAIESGKVVLIGGESDLGSLVRSITDRLDAAMAQGYRLIRFLGFIGWGQLGWPDDRALLEFESRVNDVVRAYPAVILCTYSVPALSGPRLIRGGLQTHPVTVIGDRVIENSPYYVEPDEFISALEVGPDKPN